MSNGNTNVNANLVFAIVFMVVQPLDGERVFENIPRHFKGDTMIGFVPGRFRRASFMFATT